MSARRSRGLFLNMPKNFVLPLQCQVHTCCIFVVQYQYLYGRRGGITLNYDAHRGRVYQKQSPYPDNRLKCFNKPYGVYLSSLGSYQVITQHALNILQYRERNGEEHHPPHSMYARFSLVPSPNPVAQT